MNYAPVQRQVLRDIFGVEPPPSEWKPETGPKYAAPIIRRAESGIIRNGVDIGRECVIGLFGMVPQLTTTNARVETIGVKPNFARYWRAGQLCLIPATGFSEPNYETGKPVRWKIGLPDWQPFAIAGLWRDWPDGSVSFTMPTLNADSHPLLKRFHKPGDEKRGVVILPRPDWADWLACRDTEVARTMLRLLPADQMFAEPAPMQPHSTAARAEEPPTLL